MELQGLHHITMITGDAQKNVDFYADTLGLRLVKKTVNFDSPGRLPPVLRATRPGRPARSSRGSSSPGARRGRAGAGHDPHDPARRGLGEALDFWTSLDLSASATRRFEDYDGLRFELVVSDAEPQRAVHPEIPEEFAITGIVGARAYGATGPHPVLTETLGFTRRRRRLHARRASAGATTRRRPQRGLLGAGTVHHIAWASRDEDHLAWQRARAPRPAWA